MGYPAKLGSNELVTDEIRLRNMARAAMQAGKLPRRRPQRMWGGPGIGMPCVICAAPVKQDELGFELQFVSDDQDIREGDCHVHLRCFAAWEFERRHFERPLASKSPSALDTQPAASDRHSEEVNVIRAHAVHFLQAANDDGTIRGQDDGTVSASERDLTYRGPTGG